MKINVPLERAAGKILGSQTDIGALKALMWLNGESSPLVDELLNLSPPLVVANVVCGTFASVADEDVEEFHRQLRVDFTQCRREFQRGCFLGLLQAQNHFDQKGNKKDWPKYEDLFVESIAAVLIHGRLDDEYLGDCGDELMGMLTNATASYCGNGIRADRSCLIAARSESVKNILKKVSMASAKKSIRSWSAIDRFAFWMFKQMKPNQRIQAVGSVLFPKKTVVAAEETKE